MYHLNPKTQNPNVCRSKSCELPHAETKEELVAALENQTDLMAPSKPEGKIEEGLAKVAEELAKSEAAREAKKDGVVKVKPDLSKAEAHEVAEEVTQKTGKDVAVRTPDGSTVHYSAPRRRLTAKARARDVGHEVYYYFDLGLKKARRKARLVRRNAGRLRSRLRS